MGKIRFSILNIIFLTALISLGCAWYVDNRAKRQANARLYQQVKESNANLRQHVETTLLANEKCDALFEALSSSQLDDASKTDIRTRALNNYRTKVRELERSGMLRVEPSRMIGGIGGASKQ